MLNLGIAYARRLVGDRAENIEQAIAAYRNGLRFYTRESDPVKWSSAQNNLGIALRKRVRGDRAANLAAAAAAHEAALGVHTLTAFPWMHLRSAQLAGEVALARGEWPKATEHYRRAIEASHRLFASGLNRAEAESVAREGGELFSGAAYAAAMQNAPVDALNTLESGKARLLRVALGLDALAIPDARRQRLAKARTGIRELEGRIELLTGEERLQAIGQLETLRAEVQEITKGANAGAADSGLAAAEALLSHYKAIVLPIVTDHGALLLVVARGTGGTSVTPVPVKGLATGSLNGFLHGADPSGRVAGWLGAYAINYLPTDEQQQRQPEWLRAIQDLPPKLWDLVGAALAEGLEASGAEADSAVLWIPQGALGLLPIATAADGASRTALIDRYTLSIAPSLAAGQAALRRANAPAAPASLTAVVNPTGDLRFTEPEGSVALSYFEQGRRTLLGSTNARLDTVIASLAKSSHWHFATHGTFSWSSPAQSALLLAGDDRLAMRDMFDRTDMGHPRLVVLSACETGVFDFQRAPDEFIGLPAAFLQAGAAGVVGTLWPVDDTSTALAMMKFYDLHLANRTMPALALRRAQLWLRDVTRQEVLAFVGDMRRSGRLSPSQEAQVTSSLREGAAHDKPFSHPFYWAAFQFYGS
jgi:CHAT domain-containing protein